MATSHVPASSTGAGSKPVATATEEALQKVGVNSAALKLLASAEKDQSRDTYLPTRTPTPSTSVFPSHRTFCDTIWAACGLRELM